LIADPTVEAVVVVTPPSLCPEICLEAVQARKPILIEKPLAPAGREARAMVTAAEEEADLLFMTAQAMRFGSTIFLLKEHVPEISRLRYTTFTSLIETKASARVWSPIPDQRGTLLEFGVHLLDVVPFLTGKEVVAVCCELEQERHTMCPGHCASRSGRVVRTEWVGTQGQIAADWCHQRVT
jgi:predicted dehydrogenase